MGPRSDNAWALSRPSRRACWHAPGSTMNGRRAARASTGRIYRTWRVWSRAAKTGWAGSQGLRMGWLMECGDRIAYPEPPYGGMWGAVALGLAAYRVCRAPSR